MTNFFKPLIIGLGIQGSIAQNSCSDIVDQRVKHGMPYAQMLKDLLGVEDSAKQISYAGAVRSLHGNSCRSGVKYHAIQEGGLTYVGGREKGIVRYPGVHTIPYVLHPDAMIYYDPKAISPDQRSLLNAYKKELEVEKETNIPSPQGIPLTIAAEMAKAELPKDKYYHIGAFNLREIQQHEPDIAHADSLKLLFDGMVDKGLSKAQSEALFELADTKLPKVFIDTNGRSPFDPKRHHEAQKMYVINTDNMKTPVPDQETQPEFKLAQTLTSLLHNLKPEVNLPTASEVREKLDNISDTEIKKTCNEVFRQQQTKVCSDPKFFKNTLANNFSGKGQEEVNGTIFVPYTYPSASAMKELGNIANQHIAAKQKNQTWQAAISPEGGIQSSCGASMSWGMG